MKMKLSNNKTSHICRWDVYRRNDCQSPTACDDILIMFSGSLKTERIPCQELWYSPYKDQWKHFIFQCIAIPTFVWQLLNPISYRRSKLPAKQCQIMVEVAPQNTNFYPIFRNTPEDQVTHSFLSHNRECLIVLGFSWPVTERRSSFHNSWSQIVCFSPFLEFLIRNLIFWAVGR